MPETEKKKVGLFGKLKNIIFVEDDENEPTILPDYTNEVVEETTEEKPKVIIHDNYEDNALPSRLDKPNIDIPPLERDQVINVDESIRVEEKKEEVKVEETPSPFFNFDEDEFNILNSRVARNEAKMKEQAKVEQKEHLTYNLPPSSSKSTMSSVNNTLAPGKKPFTPSPVISPVYGILDKNYSKEDIVDKRTDRRSKNIDTLDRVRNKAYGKVEEVKEEKVEVDLDIPNIIDNDIEEAKKEEESIKKEVRKEEKIELPKENSNPKKSDKAKIMDRENEEDIELPKVEDNKSSIENELINMFNEDSDEELVSEPKKSAKLDDLEKTSTLKILDDIEKELNSIKPANNEDDDEKSDQILEKDIFNMISSMYVGGDEEDDND